jgi:DNA-binding LytR/AlgR family response regulator
MSIRPQLKIFTVEDDPSYSLELEMMVGELGFTYLGNSNNVDNAIEEISKELPDLILSDIYLKGNKRGFELANSFPDIPIIFLTAYGDDKMYAKAKELKSKAFMVKPFDKLTLLSVVDQALGLNKLSKENDHVISRDSVFIKYKNQLIRLYFKDIVSIHSEGNYCTIQTREKKYVLRISLKKINLQLNDPDLIQVHRSYMVREQEIASVDLPNAFLRTEFSEIPIGRNYKKDLISRLPKI